jgi:hypothetical protein
VGAQMPRRIDITATGPDERVRRLEEELFFARRTIIELMPDDMQRLLKSYYGCKSREDRWGGNTWSQNR